MKLVNLILCQCSALGRYRRDVFGRAWLEQIDIRGISVRVVSSAGLQSGRGL
jgi:hypothetical protein